ncbi:MAG: hypothetical protein ACYC9O_19005 [Candidatus Latescibacterota bacterium]
MEQFTPEQVEEMVREAVEKTEKSFGGTFKRLKSENEELRAELDAAKMQHESEHAALEEKIAAADRELAGKLAKVSELAVREEIHRQLAGKGPLPERFIPVAEIPYSENPEELTASVTEAIEKGRREFEATLREAGISLKPEAGSSGNPTNPAGRGSGAASDLKSASARDALRDMAKRGMLR